MAIAPPPLPSSSSRNPGPQSRRLRHERRAYPRLQISVTVNFESEHNFYCGKTRDISAGGLFIECDVPLPVGTMMTVDLQLLKTRVRAESEVMWVLLDTEGQSVGMGVRFVSLPETVREKILAFMGLRRAMLFEMDLEDDDEVDDSDASESSGADEV